MHLYGIARPVGFGASIIIIICGLLACSGDDKDSTTSSTSGGSNDGTSGGSNDGTGGGSDDGTSGSNGSGSCTGEITSCTMGSLSDAQAEDMCSLFLTAIDVPAGTKFECGEGEHEGMFITVSTKEQCVQQRPPKTCKITVGQMVACYKAAKADACAAFAGACGVLFEQDNGCIP